MGALCLRFVPTNPDKETQQGWAKGAASVTWANNLLSGSRSQIGTASELPPMTWVGVEVMTKKVIWLVQNIIVFSANAILRSVRVEGMFG